MKKLLTILLAALLVFVIPAALALVDGEGQTVNTGIGIGVGVTPGNSCPVIEQEDCSEFGQEADSVCYWVNTASDLEEICYCDPSWSECVEMMSNYMLNNGIVGRSYAFEGEQIQFFVDVSDEDGIVQDCVKVYVTLDNGVDPIEAACVLEKTWNDGTDGQFLCTFTVEPAESGMTGEYWVSVMAADACGAGCEDNAAGVISLYLNPAVGLTIAAQDEFGLIYDENGDVLSRIENGEIVVGPRAGDTVYSPYFTVENSADPVSGLYIFLMLYGTDMWDYSSSGALCPTSNNLDIQLMEYKASHLNVQQAWENMPENFAGKKFVFQSPMNFGGNFLGVGDDVTMRLRLTIPTPCRGNFQDGGQIVFVGKVI